MGIFCLRRNFSWFWLHLTVYQPRPRRTPSAPSLSWRIPSSSWTGSTRSANRSLSWRSAWRPVSTTCRAWCDKSHNRACVSFAAEFLAFSTSLTHTRYEHYHVLLCLEMSWWVQVMLRGDLWWIQIERPVKGHVGGSKQYTLIISCAKCNVTELKWVMPYLATRWCCVV